MFKKKKKKVEKYKEEVFFIYDNKMVVSEVLEKRTIHGDKRLVYEEVLVFILSCTYSWIETKDVYNTKTGLIAHLIDTEPTRHGK